MYLIDGHIDGYGKEAISKKDLRRIKKSGVLYANMDLDRSINQFPQAFLDDRQKKVLNDLKNNSGRIELSSSYSELTETDYSLRYNFESSSSKATQFLDMMNAMFWETNPVPVKAAAEIKGLCNGELRLPLVSLPEEKKKSLKAVLDQLGDDN